MVGSNWPKPHYTLLITGVCRFRLVGLLKEHPFPVAEVEQLELLEQYTTPGGAAGTGGAAGAIGEDGELRDLSQMFYQAAVQVGGCAGEGCHKSGRIFGHSQCLGVLDLASP